MAIFKKSVSSILVMISVGLLLAVQPQAEDVAGEKDLSPVAPDSAGNLDQLLELLHNDKPTLVYFYQSVTCSCTAAHCRIAQDAIADIDELQARNQDLNFISIDFYYAEEAESLYKCEVVPLIIGFNKQGSEVGRVEWDINNNNIIEILVKMKE